MKIVLKIFNFIIMAVAAIATLFIFITPTISFNSKIVIDIETFSKFIPQNEYTSGFDIVGMLGTDSIEVGIKFRLDAIGVNEIMKGDKDQINEELIGSNIDDITDILHEPVDLITEYYVREAVKRIISEEVYRQVDNARQQYAEKAGVEGSTTEEIMEEVGINDAYFTSFAYALYNASNADGATVDTVGEALYQQIDEALDRAGESGVVDNTGFSEDSKATIKDSLINSYSMLDLIEEDGYHVKKISQIAYIYLTKYLKEQLSGKVSSEKLAQQSGEELPEYSDRLIKLFVYNQMPDMVYKVISYVALGCFIGMFVFAGIWLVLLIITLIRTFTKKPWTIFGFWFWLVGSLQLVLGLGLTILGKFILPKIDISSLKLPLQSAVLAPRTCVLIPSIIFIGMIVFAIVYAIIKSGARTEIRRANDRREEENAED